MTGGREEEGSSVERGNRPPGTFAFLSLAARRAVRKRTRKPRIERLERSPCGHRIAPAAAAL
jgi:hypothetical protein